MTARNSENEMVERRDTRPSVIAETRAWILVASALLVNIVGGVWWAATISAELKALRELFSDINVKLSNSYTATEARRDFSVIESRLVDHESRLRTVEQKK